MENKEKVLQVKNLVISFKTDKGIVHAVRGVNFDLYKGETLCIVGESGSGKSVTNKAIMGISANNAIIENGSILYEGEDLIRVSEEEFHRIRGHKIGMIFQDPLSALNPVMKIGKQIIEATMINRDVLKRKFNDLISYELTQYRNNIANANYSISRFENEIEKNKNTLNEIKTLNKRLNKILITIKKPNLKKEEIESLENEKMEIGEKLSKIDRDISEEYLTLEKNIKENIEKYKARINRYATKDSDEPLKKEIIRLNKERNEALLEFYLNDDFKMYDKNDLNKTLLLHNEKLKELISLYKKQESILNKPLKEDLKLKKKWAKNEVKNYSIKLKEEYEKNTLVENEKLKKCNEKIETLRKSLSEKELSEIDSVISFNKKLSIKLNKEAKNFQELNISHTVKQKESFKEIPNSKYKELLNEKKDIEDNIKKIEQDYINATCVTKAEAKKLALEVMKEVGIPLPEKRFKQYPFEFSGGMRQRIVIAIALTANPDILICDEPTTALDVTIQAQILELINRLKVERNLSCIFITHDLGVVANMADRVAVMYAGKIVEYGLANEVFFEPKHPYTWALLSSIPDVDSKEKLEAIPGTPPDMRFPPVGDAFALRSKYAIEADFKYEPPFFKISDTHYAATWLLHPNAPKVEMPKIVKTRIENALKGSKKKGAK